MEEEQLPMLSLNHVSFACRSVKESVRFYEEVLGFILVKRPSSFDFEGAWLFNHGIGIHLIESSNLPPKKQFIDTKDCHISFQCSNTNLLVQRLDNMNIDYVTAIVTEGGVTVDQLFFHDPDGYMIEICNCQNIPILPVPSSCPVKLPRSIEFGNPLPKSKFEGSGSSLEKGYCGAGDVAAMMMESLLKNIMNISI